MEDKETKKSEIKENVLKGINSATHINFHITINNEHYIMKTTKKSTIAFQFRIFLA